jgi:hypothetical protein
VDGLQRQGHHGDLSAVQQSGDLQAGGAAVEQDGLAVRDESGDLGGDPALGVDSLVGAQREGRLLAPQQQGARPAAESFEDALRGEGVQIAPDGHLRGAGQLGEFRDRGTARVLHSLGDQSVPVCVAHTAIEHHPERTRKLFVK